MPSSPRSTGTTTGGFPAVETGSTPATWWLIQPPCRCFRMLGLVVLVKVGAVEREANVAVLDPLDGSTNASRPLPWFATSICVVDGDRPRVAVVHDHASGVRWDAIAGRNSGR